MPAKSNHIPALDTVIEENALLKGLLKDILDGNVDRSAIESALDFDTDLEDQFITSQWWFAKKAERTTVNKTGASDPQYTVDLITKAFASKGYQFNDDRQDYAVNIVGIRNQDTTVNVFNDTLVLIYWYCGKHVVRQYPITTDPGSSYLGSKTINGAGTAILKPGQYKNMYEIRKHRGIYDAVCQKWDTEVPVWRDNNKDGKLTFTAKSGTAGGINIHRADKVSTLYKVDSHSAGCQVFQNPKDFEQFMGICYKSKEKFGNKFTYTLLEQGDFV